MVRTSLKVFALFLVLLLARRQAMAQDVFFARENNDRTFYGGLTAGTNFSQVDGDGFSGYHKVGLNVGALVYVPFDPTFGASMELLYSRKGSLEKQYTEDAGGVGYLLYYKLRMNYVEVPVMLHLADVRHIQYGLGLSYGRLISSKEEAETYVPVNLDPSLYPFRKDDLSFLADIRYRFYKGWSVNLRYSRSLRSVRDAAHIPAGYGSGGEYHNLFSLRLVWLFS